MGSIDWHKAQATARESILIFRDIAFAADVAKTNLTKFLKQHGLENIRSL